LTDVFENLWLHTNPNDPDSDDDGLFDSQEYQGGTNPNDPDCPRDALESAINGQSPNAWFKLNDMTLDNTGIDPGGQPLVRTGNDLWDTDVFDNGNSAFRFHDPGDRLTLTQSPDPIGGGGPGPNANAAGKGSITLLFRALDGVTAGDRYLISQSDVSPNRNALSIFFANGGGLMLRMGNTTIPAPILSTAEITAYPNAWYYLAVTWDEARDAGEVKWYLGRVGSQLNSGTFDFANDGVVGNDGTIYVGNHSSLTSGFRNPGDGALDQVAFWNRELLAGQIAAQFILLPHGPSANLDLASWNLMLPVDSAGGSSGAPRVVPTGWLNSGFQYVDPNDPNGCKKKHFYRDTDGTVAIMVFEAPWNGADTDSTGNSPRSELRETDASGNEENWQPNGTLGTVHILQASCKVISGDSKVIIGQIHEETPVSSVPAIVLSYDPSTRVPKVTVKHSPACVETPQTPCPDTDYPFPALPPGDDMINYKLEMVGVGTSVTLNATVNTVTTVIDMTQLPYDPAPAWANTTLYFKAGSYYPKAANNSATANVTFSSLSATHR
jgi:hypothetical protein